MVIDQRNAGASVSATAVGAYTYSSVDRIFYLISAASKFTMQQNAGSVTPPVGFSNYLGITSSSAYSISGSDYFTIGQAIEGFNFDLGWGTANAKTVTLSFQVYSSLTGTFGGSLMNGGSNYSYPFTYTISSANTWTTVSITVAGPTSGTWIGATNGIGLRVFFGLGVNSSISGTAGSWSANGYYSATGATSVVGTSGATFYITGVQLEVGSSATGFEYVNYQTSLANCQRYYQQIGSGMFIGSNSTTSVVGALPLFTQMRATPTASLSGVMNVTDNSANYTQSSATINTNYMQSNGGALDLGGFSGITGFRPYWYASANSSSRFFNFSAEL
jgi:hypothetical protein